MAKDVDLSSKEWTDLVFEGKNKEYGAYTLRSGSVKRHNIAVICVLSVLAVILILLILIAKGVFKTAEDDMNVDAGKEAVTIAAAADEEDLEEDIPLAVPDEPEEVQAEEEVTATLKPIENISNFSFTFLIIILLVGGIVGFFISRHFFTKYLTNRLVHIQYIIKTYWFYIGLLIKLLYLI